MKLTKYIRDAFIRSVMNDVPAVDYADEARKVANEYLKALFSKAFPGVDFEKAKQSGWLNKTSINTPGELRSLYGNAPSYDSLKECPKTWKKMQELAEKHKAQQKERDALEDRLRSAAYSCTTRKALAELLPEFAHYLPPEDAPSCRTLPVVANMVTDFMKAGWPKNKKQKITT